MGLAGLIRSKILAEGRKLIKKGFSSGHTPFNMVFDRFRKALLSHNRAVEIVADMGEKLGGDYLFDIVYIRKTYEELYAALSECITDFELLTGGRFHPLNDVFTGIDNEIRRLVYNISRAAGVMVLFYEEIRWGMTYDVGGKNANLAELRNDLSLNVPEAFAITTAAFDEFMKLNRLDEKISGLKGADTDEEKALEEITALVMRGALPPVLNIAIAQAVKKIRATCGENCRLAVRSSAIEEDSDFSYAGQFESVLNVLPESKAVEDAYRTVIASLFSSKAAAYRRQLGSDITDAKMAVGVLRMVDAKASGVIYSSNPSGSEGTMIINATWGLGKSVVEGQTDADYYVVARQETPHITEQRIGNKNSMIAGIQEGGTELIATPDSLTAQPSLTPDQVIELARLAAGIEKHFKRPQDIEWAIDRNGRIFILQSRPLKIASRTSVEDHGTMPEDLKIVMQDKGIVIQKGIGAGRVFLMKNSDDLDNFPKGAVLVAKNDSSNFIRVMPYASAIITDTGTPTSHMASLCREFRIPAVVGAGNATQVLSQGMEVTLSATDEHELKIYEGIIEGLVNSAQAKQYGMDDIYEFRKKRYVLRFISPLNLIDPLQDNFSPQGCRTMHDIIRFIHEKAVMELVESAKHGSKEQAPVNLDLPIPAGILAVDIGGGLDVAGDGKKATFDRVTSIPFRAVLRGMMHPGAWHSEAVALRMNDFMGSMMRMPDIMTDSESYLGFNMAVVSREYLNLSLRFGYHFNMVDCYCSEIARNNHIYFRFTGGATDIVKRSRRIQLIAMILKEHAFNVKTKGDLLIARLSNIGQEDMEKILDMTGRLIAYTRQLDAVLHDDSSVEKYAGNFLQGIYEI